jgi:hypothetical protein
MSQLLNPMSLRRLVLVATLVALSASCRDSAEDRLAASGIEPVYNKQTGQLEQLLSDRNGDGKQETRAFMEGAVITYIEIDRNADGAPDRWEFYAASPNVIERAEEANGPDARVTRREFYADGAIRRVADDVDLDGRPDKWEHYEKGLLARVELDLVGKGYASQRLIYGPGGDVMRIEADTAGTGAFKPVPMGRGK